MFGFKNFDEIVRFHRILVSK